MYHLVLLFKKQILIWFDITLHYLSVSSNRTSFLHAFTTSHRLVILQLQLITMHSRSTVARALLLKEE